MKNIKEIVKLFQADHSDILGLDFGASGTKAVRLKRNENTVSLVAADILPAVSFPATVTEFPIPRPLHARYVAIATSASPAIVKLLTLPIHSDKPTDVHVNELMGIGGGGAEAGEHGDFRVGYERIHESRTERKFLAAALTDNTARSLCNLFPSGIPAPCSLEISGLAGMTAFTQGPGARHKGDTVAVVDFGATSTYAAFYNRGVMALIRKFEFGSASVLKKLKEALGVDGDVAIGILNDPSFDISQILRQTMESFLQQMTISWDFVERRENAPVSHFYVSGGLAMFRSWIDEVRKITGREPTPWNPFENITIGDESIPGAWKGQESRFAAATGAALAALESP